MASSLEGKRVLVTGGAGFIGSHIVERLCSGSRVVVLDDLSSGSMDNLAAPADSFTFMRGSVNDAAVLDQACEGMEYIFHLAAMTSVQGCQEKPDAAMETNSAGTRKVLEAAAARGVEKVVLASSCAVYGDPAGLPIRESSATSPLSVYAESKLSGEEGCRRFSADRGLPTICPRLFNVYGPGQDPGSEYAAVIPRYLTRALAGEELEVFGNGEQSRDFVYIDDAVSGLIAAALCGPEGGEPVNIGTGVEVTINQLAGVVVEMFGAAGIRHLPPRAGEVKRSVAEVSLAKREMGFSAETGLEQGLERTMRHMRDCH